MSKTLAERLGDPGFTPPIRELTGLLELMAGEDEDLAKSAERAVLRIEAQYAGRVALRTVEVTDGSVRPARARLAFLVGRLAAEPGRDPDGGALKWLLTALEDEDPKTRRTAARALGKTPRSPAIESALATAFDKATHEDDKKAIALSLGKVGGDAARSRLEGEGGAKHARAALLLDRETARSTDRGSIDVTRAFPDAPLRVWFHARSGLEDVVKEELVARSFTSADSAVPPRFVSPGIVEGTLPANAPLSQATRIRTAMHIGFPLNVVTAKKDIEKSAQAIVRAITSDDSMRVFRTFSASDKKAERGERAPIRFRIAFVKGGHRRALVWRCAELVRDKTRELVNDPRDSTWEVLVDETPSSTSEDSVDLKIELVPSGLADDRFAYREQLVAASSHPTIAAALVRVAPFDTDDIVWDPFAGAGAELVERAMLGPFQKLIGTDVEAKAISAAKHNFVRAGVTAREPTEVSETVTLEVSDACSYTANEGRITLIITNPPMGRRVERGSHLELLVRFVSHAARMLAPGGALVWMVPEPQEPIRAAATKEGLDLIRAFTVDMGGFSAELSVFMKRAKKAFKTDKTKRRIVR